MNNLTAVIIAKNEEKMILDCIKSVNFADRVMVVDCQSEDKTAEISRKAGATVLSHVFKDFAFLRNYPLKFVHTDWILYIDADERVNEHLKKNILQNLTGIDSVYYLIRKNYYFGRPWPKKEKILRLFRTKALKGWYGKIHESPRFFGQPQTLNGELLHYTHRNLEEMLEKTIVWSGMEAALLFKADHPPVTWWRLIRVFITGFFNSYVRDRGFLVGGIGLIESIYQGYSMFITYVKLWELQNQK